MAEGSGELLVELVLGAVEGTIEWLWEGDDERGADRPDRYFEPAFAEHRRHPADCRDASQA